MERILFLDIDGVLNHRGCIGNEDFLVPSRMPNAWIDPKCVGVLNMIIEKFSPKVIVSSTWRQYLSLGEIQEILRHTGFMGKLSGITPILHQWRGNEIQQWMDDHGVLTSQIAILDDDDDMVHLSEKLVRTSMQDGGLREEHIQKLEYVWKCGEEF